MKTQPATITSTLTCGQCERYRPAHPLPSGRVIPSYCRLKAEQEMGVDFAATTASTPVGECRGFVQVVQVG